MMYVRIHGGSPEAGRQSAIGFVIGNKAYFGFSHRGKTRIIDFWEWHLDH